MEITAVGLCGQDDVSSSILSAQNPNHLPPLGPYKREGFESEGPKLHLIYTQSVSNLNTVILAIDNVNCIKSGQKSR